MLQLLRPETRHEDRHLRPGIRNGQLRACRSRDGACPVAERVPAPDPALGFVDQALGVVRVGGQRLQQVCGIFPVGGGGNFLVREEFRNRRAGGRHDAGPGCRDLENPPGAHGRRVGDGVDVEEDLVRLVGGQHLLVGQRPHDVLLEDAGNWYWGCRRAAGKRSQSRDACRAVASTAAPAGSPSAGGGPRTCAQSTFRRRQPPVRASRAGAWPGYGSRGCAANGSTETGRGPGPPGSGAACWSQW